MFQHTPRKRFGQHFLVDQAILQRIAATCALGHPATIVEIGPGPGALTELLLPRTSRLIAVELDRDLANALPQRFPDTALEVHQMDVLNCQLASFQDQKNPAHPPFRVVGNLPYNISTPLIFHLLEQLDQIDQMVFMVQKEVAGRLSAAPGSKQYGRLSVMAALKLDTECIFDVPPAAFDPPPKVDSTVIRMQPRAQPIIEMQSPDFDETLTAKLVTAAFAQRRKTLRNALNGHASIQQMEEAGIDPTNRAEVISPEQYVRLSLQVSAD
ncbi:MAG: 16S rRNA (adenine(1518)-N(6)/adenine(1519)-N(6))-dimethyltransferase RsmA [Acidiferrobacterales bacterium]|nr:16S rRNA (adenine(1518)-N(6)/adenine(1519)-N(6))-dimethyltransferase RsmA [Acidiferrobacterales bacterium]